jgi:hypothetical protein
MGKSHERLVRRGGGRCGVMTHRALPRRATMLREAIRCYSPEIARASSRAEDVVAFIDAGQEDVTEVDGPDAIIDFLEAEDVLFE